MRGKRLAVGLASGAAALALVLAAAAAPGDEPILHEYVAPPAAPAAPSRIVDPQSPAARVVGDEPVPGRNPAAIRQGETLLPEPSKASDRSSPEPTFGRHEFGADRETSTRPDRFTAADDTLYYTEVFNPSVLPFKRMSALDQVRPDFTLGLADEGTTDLRIGGTTSSDRDLFWASLRVDLRPGREVAIPSVAPEMRVLSYEVEPPTTVVFSKDGADNFFVRADDADAEGVYRLVFLADAPASYFGARVPRGYTLRDASRGPLRPVPAPVRREAERLFDTIGVDRSMPLDEAVDKLVAYFRSFEAGDPPPASDNVYRDLTLARRGVCRHRSYAFVVTASALGIPARYLTNEAHAFVEIWVPERRWIRVDLGGAAAQVEVSNGGDKTMHRPREADAFPRPDTYARGRTRITGDVSGLSRSPGALQDSNLETDPQAPPGPGAPPSPAPGVGLPTLPPAASAGKLPVELTVAASSHEGYRGETVRFTGTATTGGKGINRLAIDLYLRPPGDQSSDAYLVGRTVTGADGRYDLTVVLPGDLPLGAHEVFAATPGDGEHAPALSR